MVTSSIAANMRGFIYSSTKIFASNLAQSLSFTMDGLVDVLCYEPAGVDTKMLRVAIDTKKEPLIITPERAADTCFRDLGYQRLTYGDI